MGYYHSAAVAATATATAVATATVVNDNEGQFVWLSMINCVTVDTQQWTVKMDNASGCLGQCRQMDCATVRLGQMPVWLKVHIVVEYSCGSSMRISWCGALLLTCLSDLNKNAHRQLSTVTISICTGPSGLSTVHCPPSTVNCQTVCAQIIMSSWLLVYLHSTIASDIPSIYFKVIILYFAWVLHNYTYTESHRCLAQPDSPTMTVEHWNSQLSIDLYWPKQTVDCPLLALDTGHYICINWQPFSLHYGQVFVDKHSLVLTVTQPSVEHWMLIDDQLLIICTGPSGPSTVHCQLSTVSYSICRPLTVWQSTADLLTILNKFYFILKSLFCILPKCGKGTCEGGWVENLRTKEKTYSISKSVVQLP